MSAREGNSTLTLGINRIQVIEVVLMSIKQPTIPYDRVASCLRNIDAITMITEAARTMYIFNIIPEI